MDKKDLRIIFLGTPDFAVASLAAMLQHGFNIVAVVTAPDKPAGRGMQLKASPVKQFAIEHHIPVLQPVKLKSQEFIEELRSYRADLQVVIAFRMLPEVVWNMPCMGTVNLHASLLPDYRGAAPINWAIINGEKQSGVTTFLLKHEIDTGDMILQESCQIPDGCNAGQLHDLLMHLGANVIVKTVNQLAEGTVKFIPQANNSEKIAPKIFTNHCEINWNKPGEEVLNQIRGLSPYPGAFTLLGKQVLKVYNAHFIGDNNQHQPANWQIEYGKKPYLCYEVLNGKVYLDEVQLEGKRKMTISNFLNGWKSDT